MGTYVQTETFDGTEGLPKLRKEQGNGATIGVSPCGRQRVAGGQTQKWRLTWICHKTAMGVVLKRHGPLESLMHRKGAR
ncbi:hypothetical protein KSD_41720 [Ktedonobacter sp. SOSP1-85]|nr:hypothetical protein KSD_41720 [Ktedonobacter sp. SOSP1-85]